MRSLRVYLYFQIMGLKRCLSNPNTWYLLLADCCCMVLSHVFAHLIRFEFEFRPGELEHFLAFLPFLFLFRIPTFYMFGLYSGMWRFTSIRDLVNVSKAVGLSSLLVMGWLLIENRFLGYSRSVFVIDTVLTFVLVCGVRLLVRWALRDGLVAFGWKKQNVKKKRLLIVGAGGAAEKTIIEIKENQNLHYNIVGLLDDNKKRKSLRIHDVPVWGELDEIQFYSKHTRAEEILVAISSLSGEQVKRIVTLCQSTKLPFKIIPGIGEVIDGRVTVGMRDVSYKDLLGREEVKLEADKIGNYLTGKTVLITGGGGSIGSELTRQIVAFQPENIILYDSSEENLYNLQMELLHELKVKRVVPVLGQIQDLVLLNFVFSKYLPTVVFHAAAYKHVPLVENNPWQAVENNIVASQLLMEAAILYSVERFVIVSTDKAVRPTNVMGASKRMVELLMSAYRRKNWQGSFSAGWMNHFDSKVLRNVQHKTVFMAVRFGNVLGSSGSVVPLFKKQIKAGGPVTVTHPEITRYFMSIEEAAQLILQAGTMARGGEIYILKMGEPIKIVDIACHLIELAGKKVHEDIKILFVGLREGEKMHEELVAENENVSATSHKKILILNSKRVFTDKEAISSVKLLREKALRLENEELKHTLSQILPEYKKWKSEFTKEM